MASYEAPVRGDRCPDSGYCHHNCERACFRVLCASPLSGTFPNDEWPEGVKRLAKILTEREARIQLHNER